MTNLSPHFTREDFTRSQTAIRKHLNNSMNAQQEEYAKELCENVLEKIYNFYGGNVSISSGFRSVTVNAEVGGSSTSDHCFGRAADFHINGKSLEQVYSDIKNHKIPGLKWKQLIFEGAWIHIAYDKNNLKNQCLIAHFHPGKPTTYTPD